MSDAEPRRTLLNAKHRSAGAKFRRFAGWEMPLHYPSGLFREHAAVRSTAGLFDVSHMGIFEVAGEEAAAFLEAVLASTPSRLKPGQAQYGYLLAPDGLALDDLYVFRLARDRFWLVVNAANTARDWEHLAALNLGRAPLDPAQPGRRAPGPVVLRDLREAGPDAKISLALQGPRSADLLCDLADSAYQREALRTVHLNVVLPDVRLGNVPVVISGTGYTGSEVGFELFVHPDRAAELWDLLLDHGRPRDLLPAGLGARDSLRLEAGFPLFGQELEGPQALTLTEADYGFVVRGERPFFVGRDAYLRRLQPRRRRLLRLKGRGRRSVRAGHAVLDGGGQAAGVATSFAYADRALNFFVLAAVRADFKPSPGSLVQAARAAPEELAGHPPEPEELVTLTALTRFPSPEEKAGWPARYGAEQ